MKITATQYAQALFELMKESPAKPNKQIIKEFAGLLVKRHEVERLPEIIDKFDKLWAKEFKIITAEIKSFSPLNDQTKKMLAAYLQTAGAAQELSTKFTIDQNILGGVVIKYGDKMFDASLKLKLNKLKETIIN